MANRLRTNWHRRFQATFSLNAVLACLLSATAGPLSNIRFESLIDSERLPTPWIRQVHQDHEGFIWLVTHTEPLRFDGTRITRFPIDSGPGTLPRGRVNRILSDHSGTVWILTNNGLARHDRSSDTFRSYPLLDEIGNSLTTSSFCFELLPNGWLAAGGQHGLFLFDPQREEWVRQHRHFGGEGRAGRVHDIEVVSESEFLVGAASGLWTYDLASGRSEPRRLAFPNGQTTSDRSARRVLIDSAQRIWIAEDTERVHAFSPNGDYIELSIEGQPITQHNFRSYQDVFEDRNGIVWLAPAQGGLLALEPRSTDFKRFRAGSARFDSPLDHTILSISDLSDGSLCFSTFNNGVFMLGSSRLPTRHYTEEQIAGNMRFKLVTSIHPSKDGSLWVAGPRNEIARFNPTSERFTYPLDHIENKEAIANARLSSFAETPQGDLVFLADERRLLRYLASENRIEELATLGDEIPRMSNNQNETTIKFDRHGYLWLLRRIPVRFDLRTRQFHVLRFADGISLDGLRTRSSAELPNGDFWFGSYQRGLAYYDRKKDLLTLVIPPESNPERLSYNAVSEMALDSKQRLWFGTTSGLSMLDPSTMRFDNFNDIEELGGSSIHGLKFDEQGRLWISTASNLLSLDPKNRETRRFSATHGLLAAGYTQNALSLFGDGIIAIGGVNGLDTLDLNQTFQSPTPPQPKFLSVSSESQADSSNRTEQSSIIDSHEALRFDYGVKELSFDFARLNFTNRGETAYRYMIEGLSNQWLDLGDTNSINLPGLPPGDYTLRLKGFGLNGSPDSEEATLALGIAPPIWQGGPFLSLSSIALISMVLGLIKLRTRAINRRNRELEAEVTERTKELDESREEAVAANAAKSEFIACMSHEIRTPMNGIVAMNQLLLHSELGPKQREYSEIVDRSADTLLELIDEILDFSKIEANELKLESAPFDLRELVEDTALLLKPKATEKGLKLRCLVAPQQRDLVLGDAHRLKQAITNLIGNAIKFTEQGSVTVSISQTQSDGSKGRYECIVEDTGIGVPKERQSALFEPFSQADRSTTRKYGGTGLGLSITKRIVEAMGGSIELLSEPGQGSQFKFSVDLTIAPETSERESFANELAGKRILLFVNDEVDSANLAAWLNWSGAQTIIENDKERLNRLLADARIDSETPISCLVIDRDCINNTITDTILYRKQRDAFRVVALADHESSDALSRKSSAINATVSPSNPVSLLRILIPRSSQADNPQPDELMLKSAAGNGAIKVLSVDDNALNLKILEAMLLRFGFEVDNAKGGLQGVELANENPYDIIFMDCMMPDLHGFDATRKIRSNDSSPNRETPIIALTANAMKGDKEQCLDAGMSDYLSKPLRLKDVERVFKDHISSANTLKSNA